MAKLQDEYMVCEDCFMGVVTGDLSGLLENDEYRREKEINDGIHRLSRDGYLVPGSDEKEEEFSWAACQCCGTTLGGRRYQILKMDSEE